MDPQLTKDGKPYGPQKYKQLVYECYCIAKQCNTPYNAVLDLSCTERSELIRLIIEENEKRAREVQELTEHNKHKNLKNK